eukprot:CAMPEP_0204187130 /NCGR_PEP_ID=MMETSP0361-20130328/56555_1 /ASSEMBLY_ACC=CAM_ASM_000343 /TAXON_ID=268821 /ORGANISM="Scrippsiella Hangoei, Strain SHTV-5" /LENGTH=476 /DNA_ID=CAMNT_0051147495 /DNA_START=18 /DNA_END=1445 /DNA_ORIENTATION=+
MAPPSARPLRQLLSSGALVCLAAARSAAAQERTRGAAEAAAERPRVAIVGGGIAGSSVAWFLRNEGLDVTIFEAARVGGRVQEVHFPRRDRVMVEAGGAAIHSLNLYMGQFIDVLGLHRDTGDGKSGRAAAHLFTRAASEEGGGIASWDGQKLSKVSPFSYPLSTLRARGLVTEVTKKWEDIYRLQAANLSFAHPHDMFEKLGVAELANQSARAWLQGKVSDSFLRQFVDGVSRVNYGQDSSLNAFAEAISLAGAGLVGSLYSVQEGNARVMEGLIRESKATLRMERVTEVRARPMAGGYDVCTAAGCEAFASVALAAPLEAAKLKLGPGLSPAVVDRPYQITVATFVAASGLSSDFFKTGVEAVSADTVVTTSNASIPFNSVAVHGNSGDKKVYKLFSTEVPSQELLRRLFVNSTGEQAQFVWHAYPVLRPTPRWPPFRLHTSASTSASGGGGGLYYANAMESPVSCMETEAVAG